MRLIAVLLTFVISLTAATPAHAWGARGHRLIAEIAYAQLTPRARAQVDALLASDFSASPGCPLRSFEDAALWSDCVKAIPSYRNQSSWHYDNIPFCGPVVYEDYCADGNCATAAIARAERTMRNARASSRDRQRALARLVHLIGDLHQPLHAITNNDRGGNSVRVNLVGGWNATSDADNLHALWDSALVDYALAADPGASQRLASQHVRDWNAGDPRAWAAHAHDIAVSVAYGALPGGTQCNQTPASPVAIDQRYAAAASPIVRTQLAEAV